MEPLLRYLRRLGDPDEPDAALLTRYAAGDPDAGDALVRRHGPLVWAAARRRLPDPADAADVFQATFLLLLRKRGRLAGAEAVGPWLYRVAALTARNLGRKNARRLARRRPLLDPPDPADPHLPVDLDDALLLLSERDRAAVVLCHLQGHSRREAAAMLGLSEGTLSSALNRALARLRAALGDPLPLLAAGGVLSVPAGLASAAGPRAVSLSQEVLRMIWLKKLVAGGLASTACLGLGVGVGLAPRPVAAEPPPPPPATRRVDDLRKRAAEAAARAKELADALAKEEEALRAAAAKAGPRITVRVSAEEHPFGGTVRVEETDATGKVVLDCGCTGVKVGEATLATLLRRARLDPTGPREVAMVVGLKFDPSDLSVVARTVRDAGFPVVAYTGPLPDGWMVNDGQDNKAVRSWVDVRLAKGERVDLTKVLPIGPPPADRPTFTVVVQKEGGKEDVTTVPLTGSETVLDAVTAAAGGELPAGEVAVRLRRTTGRPPSTGWQEFAVDWAAITQLGKTDTNYQLRPGDRLYVKWPKGGK